MNHEERIAALEKNIESIGRIAAGMFQSAAANSAQMIALRLEYVKLAAAVFERDPNQVQAEFLKEQQTWEQRILEEMERAHPFVAAMLDKRKIEEVNPDAPSGPLLPEEGDDPRQG